MSDATANLAKNTKQMNDNKLTPGSEVPALDRRYGAIGISAVAAAARYQGSAKNSAYAPVSSAWRDRIAEAAA